MPNLMLTKHHSCLFSYWVGFGLDLFIVNDMHVGTKEKLFQTFPQRLQT